MERGFNLLEKNCFTCHSPKGPKENRIAPPMAAIKMHYINEKTTLDEFTQALSTFVLNPNVSNSKMPGAIQKFGLMPKMDFDSDELKAIATYLYNRPIEEPNWYQNHFQEERGKYQRRQGNVELTPLEEGKAIAMATKAQLGKNLMTSIQTKGTSGAVTFCNTRAIPLTDSMAVVSKAEIRRVSDKPRNPKNRAAEEELNYIRSAVYHLKNGEKIDPQISFENNKWIGYYPIITYQMCLQCHGQPKVDIDDKTLKVLDELYPEDQAIGYKPNELRGIWVVEMNAENHKTK